MDFIFDIDGTVADISHRVYLLDNKPVNWESFFSKMDQDKPILPSILIIRSLIEAGHTVIFCTGRSDKYRRMTIDWIYEFVYPYFRDNMHLYMRQEGDRRSDTIVKAELLDEIRKNGLNPEAVFEDRQRLCEMWIEKGLWVYDCGMGKGNF